MLVSQVYSLLSRALTLTLVHLITVAYSTFYKISQKSHQPLFAAENPSNLRRITFEQRFVACHLLAINSNHTFTSSYIYFHTKHLTNWIIQNFIQAPAEIGTARSSECSKNSSYSQKKGGNRALVASTKRKSLCTDGRALKNLTLLSFMNSFASHNFPRANYYIADANQSSKPGFEYIKYL